MSQSLGDHVREYVARKFGECERGKIIIDHETLRSILIRCAGEWINREAPAPTPNEMLGDTREVADLVRLADQYLQVHFWDKHPQPTMLTVMAGFVKTPEVRRVIGATAKDEKWIPVSGPDDLPEDGVYLWTCQFSGTRDVRKIQLLTLKSGERRVGPASGPTRFDEILAYQRLPDPWEGGRS